MSEVSRPRVLVVDDAPEQLQLLLELLKDEYAVLAATHGEKALSILENQSDISLVVLDVSMPGMDGYEVCREIRRLYGDAIAVIFLSGNDSTEEVLRGFDAGAQDYLTKPVRPLELKLKIQSLVARAVKAPARSDVRKPEGFDESRLAESVEKYFTRLDEAATDSDRGEALIGMLGESGLRGLLRVNGVEEVHYFSRTEIAPLERELLDRMAAQARQFVESKGRMLLRTPDSTLLVSGFPVDCQRALENIRETLLQCLVRLDTRLEKPEEKQPDRKDDSESPAQRRGDLKQQFREFQVEGMARVEALHSRLRTAIIAQEMTERQETALLDQLQEEVDALQDHWEAAHFIQDQLD